MIDVWLLEEYDDPYVAPNTIGVFESKEQLIAAVNKEYNNAEIEWGPNRVILTFRIKSLFSDKVVRKDKVRMDFREMQVGSID
jgi:hypothetical protein